MSKIKSFLYNNLQSSKGKTLLILIATFLLYIIYSMYVWVNTQSTDNAYLDGEITFVSPEVNGVIRSINFIENQEVKKGDILIKIDDIIYKAQYEQAKNAYDGGKLDIAIIESQLELAKIDLLKSEEFLKLSELNNKNSAKEYERILKLTSDNFSSKKSYEDISLAKRKAQTEYSQAISSMKSAKENLTLLEIKKQASIIKLKALEDALIIAKNNLDNTEIKASINGVITSSSARVGGYGRVGLQLFAIVPKDNIYIKANFKETQIGKFKSEMKADVKIDAVSAINFKAKIRNIYPATGSKFSLIPTDSATGNFTKIVQRVPVILDIEIPEAYKNKIGIGYSAKVSIRTDQ